MATVDGDLTLFSRNRGTLDMTKIQANGPAVNLNATFPKKFPHGGPLYTNWGPRRLLAVGGYDASSNDIDGVFKYENGAWTDLGWTLDAAQYGGLGCTYSDKLVMIGGKITENGRPKAIEKMV